MSFKDLQLIDPLLKAIEEQGYKQPTGVQLQTIPQVLAKKDVIASAQTGTGKTAAFALPILQLLSKNQEAPRGGKTIKALIVSPTRELALQIGNNFKAYGRHTNLRTTVIFGGISEKPQVDVLAKGVDILIATPGRLMDLEKQDIINLDAVEILVLDEADLMLDMGFIDDVKHIVNLCPAEKQILLFSATMPFKVEQLANTILKSPERIEVTTTSSAAKNIGQILYYVPKQNKIELCLHLLRNEIKGSILIFRRTKFGVDKLEASLIKNGYNVETIHGDKTQTDRQEALKKFKSGSVNILIATDVAARGIDINELDAVINFDLPNIPETYIHRIGRTGRAGSTGMAYSFCGADEKNYITTIQQLLQIDIPVEESHPYPLDPNAKAINHKSKDTTNNNKKGRKSAASRKKKKRWY
ncbi:DEAD/DEAH box helicase [Bizionia argentinensis JUB59]|uniref:DEAD-box ATP-dependent RNA helicase RhpA n=1 Tax=Bizionia argentinensis JUB59 TaxID=1046627 RepID=G2EG21_9FLAO|nr:DEAD/DEAH box helicase [Bizionia argentinensis]EGV42556.1 DEAD/DEAH box helicase [Bizionia argentinensis JUB59]